MIAWQHSAALWALPLAILPVLIHLLRTHHATRILFPSLRFVPQSRTAAVRMRLPSDVLLMLVRVAIVAVAVAALAGPLLLTSGRIAAWNARTARAVVVDTSDSMRVADGSGVAPERAAADAVSAELQSATYAQRVDARRLDEGVARAAAWLRTSPPARREIVVISDMQRGAVSFPAVAAVGDAIGVRFVSVGRAATDTRFEAPTLFGAGSVAPRGVTVRADADTTQVTTEERPATATLGLRILAPADAAAAVTRVLRAVASAGAPVGDAQQRIAVQFVGAAPASPSSRVRPGWMLRTISRLQSDPSVAQPSPSPRASAPDDGPWMTVTVGSNGMPRIRAAALDDELLIDVGTGVDTLAAAIVVRSVLQARLDPSIDAEHEIARTDAAMLNALARPPAPVSHDAWQTAESTDGRWLWGAVLALLGIEQWLRSRAASQRQQQEVRHAA